MKLPKLAIANASFVIILVIMAGGLGLLSFLNMPRSEDPALDFPVYTVVAIYPGTSPQDLEELVIDPIEERLNELENVREISTRIKDGVAVITVEGEFGIDTQDQFDEVKSKVNTARSDLPDDLYSLEVDQFSPLDVKILQVALVSEQMPYRDMVDWAEKLEDRLEKVAGIRDLEIEAYPEEEIRIALDWEKMSRMNLNLGQLTGILRSNHLNIPGGDLDAGQQVFTLKTSGGYTSIEALRETVLSAQNGQIVYLKDIADVQFAYADPRYLGRYNGKRAIFLSATQKAGQNILQISELLEQELAAFEGRLPPHLSLAFPFRQGPAVAARINDFFLNLLQGILLVGAVILLFLGIRNAMIVMTVIPASIIMAIYLLDVTGYGLQQISIAGLVLALGLLVDNGIVVIENINRFRKAGLPLREAAAKGTAEVGWALVSSTATTILAFLPMTQLGGGTGEFIRSLPLTVIYSLLASLVLALAFTPLLASRLMRKQLKDTATRMDRVLTAWIEKAYRPILQFGLRKPWLVLVLALLTLVGSGALFPLVGISFFPSADKPMLLVDIDLPEGSNLNRTDQAAHFVESVLDTLPIVKAYTLNVGHGNPQIYYNVQPSNYASNHAQALVELEKWESNSFYATIAQLRGIFAHYAGAKIKVIELKNGPPAEAPVAIKVIGDDLEELRALAQNVEEVIGRHEGIINLDNPLAVRKINLRTRIHRDKAGMLGVQLADIDLAVRTAMTGYKLGTLNTPAGDKYEMVARMEQGNKARISDFQRISVPSVLGAQVPLAQVAHLEFEADASRIDHFDLARTVTVTADVADGYQVTGISLDIVRELEAMDWPEGYGFYVAGDLENQQESFGDLGQMLIIAILGIFAVLVLQFRSFRQPFVVLSAIPLAFTGSILALFLTGYSFSFLAFVGFTSLVGIVVNTSIILVDYTNQLRQRGLPKGTAILQASETRFTPILLTTLTTILGLLPLTLSGSNLWAPLGWTIIGGMVSSTLLTLLMVPILYQWLSPVFGSETQA